MNQRFSDSTFILYRPRTAAQPANAIMVPTVTAKAIVQEANFGFRWTHFFARSRNDGSGAYLSG